LMTNIFGDASDDDDGDDDEKVLSTKDKVNFNLLQFAYTYVFMLLKYGLGPERCLLRKEWDFDIMLREKKAERRRPRRRRHDGSIDVGGIYDDKIKSLMDAMKVAAKTDRSCNIARKPAVQKRILLPQVKALLIKYDLMEYIIDNGMLNIVAEWLAPLPDKSLPALEIRTTLLKILQEYNRLDQGILKQSGLGKAVMLLYKHPKETKENKILAAKLISEWARPIFHLETDFRSMTKEERIQRDYAQLSAAKRKSIKKIKKIRSLSNEADKNNEPRVGEKGFIMRARVPRVLGKDYVVRPKNNVEGQFRGATKSRANERLDRAQREFNARTKQNKFRRAIGVSIGGRNIAL
uniref:TFIIS N-terminal domain-containing protein n=1 Tax=Dracunculus medinensis TaxID=318479 RepID=A0A0N4UBC9_DRAME